MERVLREFGFIVGGALTIIAAAFYFTGQSIFLYLVVVAPFLVIFAIINPLMLATLYRLWMGLAYIFGVIVTCIILTVLFIFIFIPIGLLVRLSGKELLDTTWPDVRKSNWHFREQGVFRQENYERQF